ncbi:hypothetical protein OIDMADRAFT_21542 [Oidiodendron maius Zn]|uniref:Uncharacterized protein n=1 Tax=Oidiodendron maius (strain Zn) TaxID=913774 RepID=A0A0C3C2R7_OIDMZ|nr:hypothetical protein OIDMADRAFT_21542 [Oidiodendron maius Zn]
MMAYCCRFDLLSASPQIPYVYEHMCATVFPYDEGGRKCAIVFPCDVCFESILSQLCQL